MELIENCTFESLNKEIELYETLRSEELEIDINHYYVVVIEHLNLLKKHLLNSNIKSFNVVIKDLRDFQEFIIKFKNRDREERSICERDDVIIWKTSDLNSYIRIEIINGNKIEMMHNGLDLFQTKATREALMERLKDYNMSLEYLLTDYYHLTIKHDDVLTESTGLKLIDDLNSIMQIINTEGLAICKKAICMIFE